TDVRPSALPGAVRRVVVAARVLRIRGKFQNCRALRKNMKTLTLTPALSHSPRRSLRRSRGRMGEGESSSVGRRIQALWKLRETGLAVPSLVGRRVRVRVV